MSKEPSIEPREWKDLIEKLYEPLPLSKEKARPIINAALADLQTDLALATQMCHIESKRANEAEAALATEREKSRVLGNITEGLRKQIKEHQAEYDRLSKIIEKDYLRIVELEQQLAAELERHKTLVDALEWAAKVLDLGESVQAEEILRNALASVKEQP